MNQYSISSSLAEVEAAAAARAGGTAIIIIPVRGRIGGLVGGNKIIVFHEESHRSAGGKTFYQRSSFLIIHNCKIYHVHNWCFFSRTRNVSN